MIIAESAGMTDTGRVRENNEDAYLTDDALNLYVVADGMGGYSGGEIASRMVVESLHSSFLSRKKPEPAGGESFDETVFLKETIENANRDIFTRSKELNVDKGMGSTVAAVCFLDSSFVAGNVGDSHIYLVRDQSIEMISTPHTVAHECESRDPDLAQVLKKSFRHILTRSVGVTATVLPDVLEFPCSKGDIIVLCSDGLSNMVTEEDILLAVKSQSPEGACRHLVNMANEKGGTDNITVVVIRVKRIIRVNPLTRFFYKWFRRALN